MSAPVKPGKGLGRKPASIGTYGTQDALWACMLTLRTFTLADIVVLAVNKGVLVSQHTASAYIKRLRKGGFLSMERQPHHSGPFRPATYTVVRDLGLETPRLRRDGAPSVQGSGRAQMWTGIKVLQSFDYQELAICTSTDSHQVTEASAKHYCELLAKAGYLVVVEASTTRKKARYRLIPRMYTGPKPPQIQRLRRVYDPNTNLVMWQEGDKEVRNDG